MKLMRAVLRGIFGTDTEMALESERKTDEAARSIDRMEASSKRLAAATRPAKNFDEAMKQISRVDS